MSICLYFSVVYLGLFVGGGVGSLLIFLRRANKSCPISTKFLFISFLSSFLSACCGCFLCGCFLRGRSSSSSFSLTSSISSSSSSLSSSLDCVDILLELSLSSLSQYIDNGSLSYGSIIILSDSSMMILLYLLSFNNLLVSNIDFTNSVIFFNKSLLDFKLSLSS